MIRRSPFLLLVLLLAVQSCGGGRAPAEPVIDRERFVAVNVALRQIDRDAEAADSLRGAVLEEHAVTQDDLHAFVRARGDRPDELAAIWSEIHERLIAIQLEEDARPSPDHGDEPEEAGEPGQPRPEPAGVRPGPLRVDLDEARDDEAADDASAEAFTEPGAGRPALRAPVPRRPAPQQ